jgi:polar amino acid transport system substrate-binding protein
MKKILALGLSCVLTASLFTGCGEQKVETPAPAPTSAPEVKVIKLGDLEHLNGDEATANVQLKETAEKFVEITGHERPLHEMKFYPNFNAMQMALESGQIEEMVVSLPVANYLMAKNPKFEILEDHMGDKFTQNICLALRAEDAELKAAVDKAISEMKNDGTLDNLEKTYITDLKATEEPAAVEFEKFEGADTITVAVTGDLPPLDYVSAEGKAAGFNTAVLAELGKRLQKNINVIQVESAARAATLTSNKADMIFWSWIPSTDFVSANIIPADVDKPEGIELSTPYYNCPKVHIALKK